MRRGLAAVALLALTAAALAQPADQRVSPLDKGWSLRLWPDMVKALQPGVPPLTARQAGSGVAQALTMAGREDLVPFVITRTVCKPLLRDGKPVDAIAYLADAAQKAPITMIGEAHEQPQTRDFIMQLAAALRSRGYSDYAAETFGAEIGEKGPAMPLASDGTYSAEPIYGRLLRRLRQLDYSLLPYEADFHAIDSKLPFKTQMEQREILQAANLTAQMKRARGKMLVHTGEGHHAEYFRPESIKLMGTVFAETNGINALTINLLTQEAPGTVPVVCDPAAFAGQPPSFDFYVGMPKREFERGRPRWRLEAGDRFADIPASLRRSDQFAVYEARPAGERGDSTPMDRLLLRPGESLPLLLPPGRYDLSVWTEKDGWSAVVTLTVAAR